MANEAVDKTPKRNSTLTIVGLVLAIIALTTSWVPIINNIAFALGAAALIMGVMGIVSAKKGKTANGKMAIAVVVIAVISCALVLQTQSHYAKVLDDASNKFNKSMDNSTGKNTEELQKTSLDVKLGKLVVKRDKYFTETKLPVALKNKTQEKASFSVRIEAVDASGKRITDDTIYANDLGAGQSVDMDAFKYIESDKLPEVEKATIKVVSVSKY